MNRRYFLKISGMSVLGLMYNYSNILRASTKQPNIIYIIADDLGYGDVSCLNPESKIQTPYMDKFASEGMIFTDAHSGSTVCTPTRYGILTGRYSWRSTLKEGVLKGHSPALIDNDRLTVADLMKKSGYKTACIGKWHLGMEWPTIDGQPAQIGLKNVDFKKDIQQNPLDIGFGYFFGLSASLGMAPHTFIENRRVAVEPTQYVTDKKILKGKLINGREGWMAEGWDVKNVLPEITNRAINYIRDRSQEKEKSSFFLYFALSSPHRPVVPNDEFLGGSHAGKYGDFVVETDWSIGRVLAAVKKAGIEDNTMIIITSDNGPEKTMIARKKEYDHYSAYHFKGCKRDNWDGGHRIPFFVKWPKRIKPGSISEELICLTDLMATCADIVNRKLPDNAAEDSISILPVMLGKNNKKPIREAIVHHSSHGYFAIRQGKWKLLLHDGSGGNKYPMDDDSPVQLYDIENDYAETKNLYKEYPEIVEKLSRLMKRYVINGRSTPGKSQKNDRPEFWHQLKWMENIK